MYDVTVPVNHYRKDSRPVVGSFLNRLSHEGFKPTHVDDGEGWEKLPVNSKGDPAAGNFFRAKEMVTAVDDSNVHFKHKSGGTLTVYFILANDPEEIAADWSVTRGETSEAMERAWSEFSRIWEGRDWPKKGGENA
tara:strand:+ start:3194 stop:3601 length:408 start_codon:yes stop_codon:yes gene_type:complete